MKTIQIFRTQRSQSHVKQARSVLFAILLAVVPMAHATLVSVAVDTSDSADWTRSDGGTGSVIPVGGPSIWSASFSALIPTGATGISFTLDTFLVDDKGVLQLNDMTIADAIVLRANGTAAGIGTFDFGLGAGNQTYNYTGFVPGTIFSLPDGTTDITLTAYVNDTGVVDPSAPPLSVANISGFFLQGTLNYNTVSAVPIPATAWLFGSGLLGLVGVTRKRRVA